MKKIILSLAVIAVVAVVAVGATRAYFSDTEISTGNTFSAGTIDIAVDGQNQWTSNYSIGDLKPGETGYINFDITNVGQNPVNVSKNLSDFVPTTGSTGYACPADGQLGLAISVSSEPECVEAQATGSDVNDVQSKILYDLSVKVYATNSTSTNPIWWQTIYTGAPGETLENIYPDGGTGVALGMIPVGGLMTVTQSYHFDSATGNEYQGDTLSFKMTIKADQMTQSDSGMTTVTLENKEEGANSIWDIVQGDGIAGTLNYKNQGSKFDFNFTGNVATNGNYTLLYVGSTNNYPATGSIALGTATCTVGTPCPISGSVDTGSITNGKIWLVPSSSYNGSIMTSWPASNILFETGLINYTQN